MSTANAAKGKAANISTLLTANAADTQANATRLFSQTNELMITMARALWDSQTKLLQTEIEQAVKTFSPPATGGDPSEIYAAYCQQWHESSERRITHMRQVNDLIRDYNWQVFETYADSLGQSSKPK
ncbi:phasin family protein [Alcaligenaceae bacterium CGII-47]|nr:phasin family protein [Alcaligenaceae bacterium CGII-47]